jgi:hypothetical protein
MPTNINGNTGIDKVQDGTVVSADIDTLDASKLTGSIAAARIASNTIDSAHIASGAVDDAHISGIAATKLTGTIADARFPSTLPAASAANLTAIPAANITGTLPAISGANLTGLPAGGITEADQWRIHTGVQFGNDTTVIFTANWERADTGGYGKVGTGMSQSSGVFTFPSTGFWLITFNMRYGGATNDARYIWSKINTTVDNSSYDNAAISYGNINPGSSYWYGVNECKFIFDVTNTSTHKVKFSGSSIVNDMKCYGNSNTNETYATFMKLGDT